MTKSEFVNRLRALLVEHLQSLGDVSDEALWITFRPANFSWTLKNEQFQIEFEYGRYAGGVGISVQFEDPALPSSHIAESLMNITVVYDNKIGHEMTPEPLTEGSLDACFKKCLAALFKLIANANDFKISCNDHMTYVISKWVGRWDVHTLKYLIIRNWERRNLILEIASLAGREEEFLRIEKNLAAAGELMGTNSRFGPGYFERR